jgi:hypothetical protein
MFCDSFDLKLYIYFDFQNLSIYNLYMYYYWPYAKILWLSTFRVVSDFSGTTKAVWTGHSRICPAPGLDMSGSQVPGVYKGVLSP